MSAPKHSPKRDANEKPIVDAHEKCGRFVVRLHQPVDLLIGDPRYVTVRRSDLAVIMGAAGGACAMASTTPCTKIREAMRRIRGAPTGAWLLQEVKNPEQPKSSREPRSKAQVEFLAECKARGLPVPIVETPEEAIAAVLGRLGDE